MEWIKINPEVDEIPEAPFLICDEYERVDVGSTAFDYYDSVWWCPMPKFPFGHVTITNDDWVTLAAKSGMLIGDMKWIMKDKGG